jgi:hypothetical protein
MRVTIDTEPSRPGQPNLDWAGCTTRTAIVLDGLTEGPETGCLHGTGWFVHQLGTRLLQHTGDDHRSLADSLALSIEQVAALHRDGCDLSHPGSPCTTVAMIRQRGAETDYLVLSDATVVLDSPDAEPVAVIDASYRAVSEPLAALAGGDLVRFIRQQQSYRNTPGGYWVAQTDPAAAEHALTATLAGVTGAVAASDGAALLSTDFGLLDWRGYLDLAYQEGPAGLITATRRAEHSDPERTRWPRYKVSDDATAAVCRMDPDPSR